MSGGAAGPVSFASAGLFDPSTSSWTSVNLGTVRRRHTATSLASGKILVAGGENASEALTSVDFWKP